MTKINADLNELNTSKSALDIVHAIAKIPTKTGETYVSHTFNAGPTRRAQRSRSHTAARLASQKTGATKEAESISIEFPLLLECEMDPRVRNFQPQPQPVQLDYLNRDNKRVCPAYTPDVLIEFNDGRVALVECKPLKKVEREHSISNPRFSKCSHTKRYFDEPANDATAALGIPHVIITSADIANRLHANYVFLRSYLKSPSSEGVRKLVAHMHHAGVAAYQDLTRSPSDAWTADDVNIAILHKAVHADLHRYRLDGLATVPIYASQSLCDLNAQSTDNYPLLDTSGKTSLSSLSPKELAVALSRFNCISPALHDENCELTRKQRNWLTKYKKAAALNGNGIFALAPNYSARGDRSRRLHPDAQKMLDDIVESAALSPIEQKNSTYFGALVTSCKQKGLRHPSKQTFYKRLRKRLAELDSIKAKGGAAQEYQKAPAKPLSESSHSRESLMPWTIGLIDHTPLPIRLVASRTRTPINKSPWLTKLVDKASNAILGFYITWEKPNSDHVLAVLWDCCRRFKRLPETIALDGERPHDSISVEQVLAANGVDKISRRYKSPRDGSAVERSFKHMQDALLSHLDGNYVERPNPLLWNEGWRPTQDASLTMGALWLGLDNFYFKVCNQEIRLQSTGNLTPYEYVIAMEQGYGSRDHLKHNDLENSAMLILPYVRRLGSRTLRRESGVRFYNQPYLPTTPVAGHHYDDKYEVKYDPLDIRYVLVYIGGKWTRFQHRHIERFQNMDSIQLAAISVELIESAKLHNERADDRAVSHAAALDAVFSSSPDPLADWLEQSTTSPQAAEAPNPWSSATSIIPPDFDVYLED